MIQGRIGIWKCWFLRRGEHQSTRRKTSRNKGENQQQTQPTYGVYAGSWTRATLVGGECSHHCATLAPQGSSNCSRQFQFTHGNTHGIFRFAHHLSTSVADSGHQQSKRKIKSRYLMSIFKMKSGNQKSKVDSRTSRTIGGTDLHETGTGRTQTGMMGMSSYRSPYISFHAFT